MTNSEKNNKKRGRPPVGKQRTQIVNEAKARYRTKLKTEGKVFVSFPISKETNFLIKENAKSYGKSASLLMTEILESAIQSKIRLNDELGADQVGRLNEREKLYIYFENKLIVNAYLTRKLVSFQDSKKTPYYRWLKYKEAFSPALIEYLLDFVNTSNGSVPNVLDPFAGTGTVLTRSAARGWKSTGIELLPVGTHALKARFLSDKVNLVELEQEFLKLKKLDWNNAHSAYSFNHIRITNLAFSEKTEKYISVFNNFLDKINNEDLKFLFWFASLSILEEVSFTRKDGQYLRWDYRSGRKLAKKFDKGEISTFPAAITRRLEEIREDLLRRNSGTFSKNAEIINGSCLFELPTLKSNSFDAIITSPPYCNRYDYTRTYALELAYSDYGEDEIKSLRQTLLSATVENKSKRYELKAFYDSISAGERYRSIELAFESQLALKEILTHLEGAKNRKELSNNNIPIMVYNYFFEMAVVIFELTRTLKPGGTVFMVNDNVRYHGEEIPVDLILSDFAEKAGLSVEKIWVLPRGKGNSSQQMGKWGRVELRKCIYYWRKK